MIIKCLPAMSLPEKVNAHASSVEPRNQQSEVICSMYGLGRRETASHTFFFIILEPWSLPPKARWIFFIFPVMV